MRNIFTTSQRAKASNPGNVKLKPTVWLFHDLRKISIQSFLLLFSIVLFVVLRQDWMIMLILYLLFRNGSYWLRMKDHFQLGDSNGGIVVSVNPTLVAVTTDLRKGYGEYPVVKIIEFPSLKDVIPGEKIATIALYTESEEEYLPHWIDFHPIPLVFANDDEELHINTVKSYTVDYWENLERRLQDIERPFYPGIYIVDEEISDWGMEESAY